MVAVTAATCFGTPAGAHARHHHRHYASATPHVLQCVAFVRSASDIVLRGNAVNWWQKAEGVYARGTAPEVGSVLNFRAISRMRLGHVAVVTDIVDSRTIQIDQSHWNANGISRDVSVVDVSQNNDWSAVRVEIGHRGTFGSIYPTYGFIYPRADPSGEIITARGDAAPVRVAVQSSARLQGAGTEVAEAPALTPEFASTNLLGDDAPNRSLQ
ncbi:CHAP domain-containing protein [Lichenicoccus sp.]|uniref:CHAP domain-containing protein n=1 Tax=Lichenicoccus sp. TaxID=2781899 RepID=UPI003D107D12